MTFGCRPCRKVHGPMSGSRMAGAECAKPRASISAIVIAVRGSSRLRCGRVQTLKLAMRQTPAKPAGWGNSPSAGNRAHERDVVVHALDEREIQPVVHGIQ